MVPGRRVSPSTVRRHRKCLPGPCFPEKAAAAQPVLTVLHPSFSRVPAFQEFPGKTTFTGIARHLGRHACPQECMCAVILHGKNTDVFSCHSNVAECIAFASLAGKEDTTFFL